MRAMVSLVQSCLVGIGVFVAMTLSLCVALTFAIAGPPTKSELADLRALIADTLRSLTPAERDEAAPAPIEQARTQPAPEPPPPPRARDRPPRREHIPLLGAPQTASPAAEQRQADPRRPAPRVRETPAPRPPPAIDSRAVQIARDAEALLATLPPPPDKDAAPEIEASAPTDAWGDAGKEESGAPQSYEEWAETWTPFGHEDPDEAPDDAWQEAP